MVAYTSFSPFYRNGHEESDLLENSVEGGLGLKILEAMAWEKDLVSPTPDSCQHTINLL